MDTMLENVKSKIGQLQANRIAKLQVKNSKSEWGEVKATYLGYKIQVRTHAYPPVDVVMTSRQVSKLQDYYPSPRIEGGATSSLMASRNRQLIDA